MLHRRPSWAWRRARFAEQPRTRWQPLPHCVLASAAAAAARGTAGSVTQLRRGCISEQYV